MRLIASLPHHHITILLHCYTATVPSFTANLLSKKENRWTSIKAIHFFLLFSLPSFFISDSLSSLFIYFYSKEKNHVSYERHSFNSHSKRLFLCAHTVLWI
ncbi:hypothetical protein BDF14DRAFT_1800637 [Spinellus fusiger]|nr:hypothetical protein BDF14DRAFT_1800637 [Spinellus fusiger]